MSENTKINPNTVREEAYLYRSLEAQGKPVDDIQLPDPTPSAEWLLKEADYDTILHGLLLSQEENENTWAQARREDLPEEEFHHHMDQYDLARWGLDKAVQKRKREIREKQTGP